MFRMKLVLAVSAVLLFLGGVTGAQSPDEQAKTSSPSMAAAQSAAEGTDALACTPSTHVPDDQRWLWRLRAYNHLDCVTTIVDRALGGTTPDAAGARADDTPDTVTISRAELERIRTLALWARDAAARIEQ